MESNLSAARFRSNSPSDGAVLDEVRRAASVPMLLDQFHSAEAKDTRCVTGPRLFADCRLATVRLADTPMALAARTPALRGGIHQTSTL